MDILPITTDIGDLTGLDNIVSTKRHTGTHIKKDLGLENYPYVYIQKILNGSIPIFIVTFDSRRPNIYLSPIKVRKIDTSQVKKIKKYGKQFIFKDYKMTLPILIEDSNIIVSSGNMFIIRDIAGEYYKGSKRPKINESRNDKFIIVDYNREVI